MFTLHQEVLRQPFFSRLLAARVISNFGNGMAPTALAFGVLGLPGADQSDLSAVLTAQAIPLVLLLPLGGVFADRYGRARMIASMDVILSGVVLLIAFMFATDSVQIPVLIGLAAMMGLLNAMWYPAYPGLPADLVEDEHLQTANSYISFGSNLAMITGAATGGFIVDRFSAGWALGVDAMTFFVAGVIVWTFRHTSKRTDSGESMFKELHDGWKVFISYKWVVVVVACFSLIVLAIRATEGVLGPVVAKEHFSGALSWSAVVGAESVGLLIGAYLGTIWRPSRPIFAGMLVTFPAAGLMFTLAIVAPLPVIMASAALWGIGIELMMIWWITALQTNIPKESIGRVSAYDAFGSLLFGPIGLALAGPVSLALGTGPALLAAAALTVTVILASLLSRSVRELRSIESPAIA